MMPFSLVEMYGRLEGLEKYKIWLRKTSDRERQEDAWLLFPSSG